MKLRIFKRMFVEKIICAGSLKLDAGSLSYTLNFFNIAKINLHHPASSFLITHFYNLPCILRRKFFVFAKACPVSFCESFFYFFSRSLKIFRIF